MPEPPFLPAGANLSLGGTRVRVVVTGAPLTGLAWVAPGRVLPLADAAVAVRGPGVAEVALERVEGASVRLVAWGRDLGAVRAVVEVAGAPRCAVACPGDAGAAVELLELYHPGPTWKVRAVASGWSGGLGAMAAALGLPASAFVPLPSGVGAGAADPSLRTTGRRAGRGLRPPGGEESGPKRRDRSGRGLRPPAGTEPLPPRRPSEPAAKPAGPLPPRRPSEPSSPGRPATPGSVPPPRRPSPSQAAAAAGAGEDGLAREVRRLVDQLVGAGPRGTAGARHVTFALGPVTEARAELTRVGGGVVLDVALLLGPVALDDRIAEAALRAAGRSLLGRVVFEGGRVWAAASAAADPVHVDVGVLATLLRAAWQTAADVVTAAGLVGQARDVATAELPRTLRRASPGHFAPQDAWDPARHLLLDHGFHPLADAPQALQAPAAGTLRLGPARLPEAAAEDPVWITLAERLAFADPVAQPGGWMRAAQANRLDAPVRTALVPEPGRDAAPALTLGLAVLPLGSRLDRRLLAGVLAAVDEALPATRERVASVLTGHPGRSDLAWPRDRPWEGPGRAPARTGLAREVLLLAPGVSAPVELPERVRAQRPPLDRAALAFLAHLALERAEQEGPRTGWDDVARELAEQVPAEPQPDAPTHAGSLHVRAARLGGRGPASPADAAVPPARRLL